MRFLSRLQDGLANLMSGLGTTADKRAHGFYALRLLSPDQIDAAYRSSWLMRKGVNLPPFDMTRSGRDWQTDKDAIGKIEAEERRLQLWPKLRRALILGRLGGGAIIIGADGDPSQPLSPTARIRYLHVVSRYQISWGQLISDPEDEMFGEPVAWQLNSGQRRAMIHPSRVIPFKGEAHSDMLGHWGSLETYWGDSVLQSVFEAVRNADLAQDGFASLIDEAKIDVVKVAGLMQQAASEEYERIFMRRMELANVGKSTHRALIIDKEEDWQQRQVTWAGMPDVIRTYLSAVAGAFDIPATRLLGKAPDGMNATGEGDERNYWTMIGSKQEADLRPALDRIDPLILAEAGAPADAWYQFSPLMVLGDKERAECDLKRAQAVQIYVASGLIPERALAEGVQNRLIEDGLLPGLEDALDQIPENERYPDMGGPDDDTDPSDLVPLEPEGGDLASAEGGVEPRRRAANDAAPRSLYVRRDVLNVAEIAAWAKAQGLPELQPGLHVTIVHSPRPLDWMKVEADDWRADENGELVIPPGGVRIVEPLGDRSAVLLFTSARLSWRHETIRRAGAEHRYPDYQPHISLTGEPVDLTAVEPYRGRIVLGPEIFEEVRA